MPTGVKDTTEEFIAIDGIVASGVYGVAAAPTTASTVLDASWTDHGLTTAAGVTRSDTATRTIRRAWQNNVKLRTITTDGETRFQFMLVQTNLASIGLANGVPLVAGSLVTNPNREWPLIAFTLDIIDGANTIREYAPRARVVEVGDRVALGGDTYGWSITVAAEYDATLGGFTKQFYSKFEGAAAVPVITTALPGSKGVSDVITLVGTGLLGTSAVTIGGVAVPLRDVVSDTKMYLTLPAGTAGSAPIIVTNVSGASAPKAYTRIT